MRLYDIFQNTFLPLVFLHRLQQETDMAGKSSVGKRIRTFREERNVDLETLSQNTGLTVNFLERMENDEIYPTIGPLQKVARSLGVRLGLSLIHI